MEKELDMYGLYTDLSVHIKVLIGKWEKKMESTHY